MSGGSDCAAPAWERLLFSRFVALFRIGHEEDDEAATSASASASNCREGEQQNNNKNDNNNNNEGNDSGEIGHLEAWEKQLFHRLENIRKGGQSLTIVCEEEDDEEGGEEVGNNNNSNSRNLTPRRRESGGGGGGGVEDFVAVPSGLEPWEERVFRMQLMRRRTGFNQEVEYRSPRSRTRDDFASQTSTPQALRTTNDLISAVVERVQEQSYSQPFANIVERALDSHVLTVMMADSDSTDTRSVGDIEAKVLHCLLEARRVSLPVIRGDIREKDILAANARRKTTSSVHERDYLASSPSFSRSVNGGVE